MYIQHDFDVNIFLAIHVVLACGFVITTTIIRGAVEV
jgi:hypothetical protein